MKTVNLYIHIPFCAKRCAYCAFYTVKWQADIERTYCRTIIQELISLKDKLADYQIATVYWGGGTPSLISPKRLESILTMIRKNTNLSSEAEITIEANPDSLTREKLEAYRKMGVNRLSLGLQAWQDEILKNLGRLHDREAFTTAFSLARETGFTNIGVDLIFGLPKQTMAQWRDSLFNVIALNPEHISCYSLELNNSSTMGKLHTLGRLKTPDEDLDRQMYAQAKKTLKSAGYVHYEISNWAKPGYQCRHNSDFWDQQPFYGLGAGASSYFEGIHFHHSENLPLYLSNCEVIEVERKETPLSKKLDWVILHLRKIEGFHLSKYRDQFGSQFPADFRNQLIELAPHRLLTIDTRRVRLTSKGMNLADWVARTLSA